ncbi:unnamed protein product [Durusdinium trenchii]
MLSFRRIQCLSVLVIICLSFLVPAFWQRSTWNIRSARSDASPRSSLAVFLHFGGLSTASPDLSDLLTCVSNVRDVAPADLHIFGPRSEAFGAAFGEALADWHLDDGQSFLRQLHQRGHKYHKVLNINVSDDMIWQERVLQALCGSRSHVESILASMSDPKPELVAPMGMVFAFEATSQVFPHIAHNISNINMSTLGARLQSTGKVKKEDLLVAADSFWINFLGLQVLLSLDKEIDFPHAHLNSWLPSLIKSEGGIVKDVQPAPIVFAIYFPQFHKFPENDRFWGENFTEWTLLKDLDPGNTSSPTVPFRQPLGIADGGLGYYDLTNYEIRRQQAQMARDHDVSGFMYYHYWFSGQGAPENHLVMQKIPELMLRDGQPDLPFFFSWANEPWTRRWTGLEDVLLAQTYGDEQEWRQHFQYLVSFFKHPKYLRINGAPVFAIYRLGHMKHVAGRMFAFWRQLARQEGFHDLHLVQTIGNFYNVDRQQVIANESEISASLHFWPQLFAAWNLWGAGDASSTFDLPLRTRAAHVQYWGAFTGFDRRPRDPTAKPILRSPEVFNVSLQRTFQKMATFQSRQIGTNLFVITAWNEWNEQAVLEPDTRFGKAYLEILRWNLRRIPLFVW